MISQSTTMRKFRNIVSKVPTVLKARNGDVILHPPNAVTAFTDPIAMVGLESLHQFIPETTESDRLRNTAQYKYIAMREKLMADFKHRWVAVSSNGSLFAGMHEEVVRATAESLFHTSKEDYYMDCVGSEALMEAVMDSSALAGSPVEQTDNAKALYFDGEFSADGGNTFKTYTFKHATGAALMGAPNDVLSQHTLVRGIDRWTIGANTSTPVRSNVYKDVHIRVCGATLKIDVIAMRTWLFGYDAYRHFTHDIDCDREPKLIMMAKVSWGDTSHVHICCDML